MRPGGCGLRHQQDSRNEANTSMGVLRRFVCARNHATHRSVCSRAEAGGTVLRGGITLNQSMTLGKIRGLSQLATARGVFSILACDQRGNMIRMLQQAGNPNPTYEDIVKVKLDIVGALSPLASGALLDAEYGAGTAIAHRFDGRCDWSSP